MTELVIIGAGIAGLVCAALARDRGLSVTVVEAGSAVGGIWKSTDVALGPHVLSLDAGLRLPVTSGTSALDKPIFSRPDFDFDWKYYDGWPHESAITANIFNSQSSCIDATTLGDGLSQSISELRSSSADETTESALDFSLNWYGPTLTNGPIRDAIMGLFGTELQDLESSAVRWFIPRRVILGDEQATAHLLKDEKLRGRVAHARHADLPKGLSRQFLRPRQGGISTWISALQTSLEQDGVRFILNDGLGEIDCAPDGRRINGLTLKSGRELQAESVISTIAPALLAQAVGAPVRQPPRFRHLLISHVLIDRPPPHEAQYSLNFNRHPTFYRAIFNDNLRELPENVHVVTLEHFVDYLEREHMAEEGVKECLRCGALEPKTTILDHNSDFYRNIIPVPTLQYGRAVAELQRSVLEPISNLRFVGRSVGDTFLDRIIQNAATTIDDITGAAANV